VFGEVAVFEANMAELIILFAVVGGIIGAILGAIMAGRPGAIIDLVAGAILGPLVWVMGVVLFFPGV
jgi:hypothetical protein